MRKQDVIGTLVDAKAEKLIAKLAEKTNNKTLPDIWSNKDSYKEHIKRRDKYSHANDEADYFNKIKLTLKSAKSFNLADGKFPSIELVNKDWSVILNHEGIVKTAYVFEKGSESFLARQTRLGYKVYEQQLTDRHREILGSLFD